MQTTKDFSEKKRNYNNNNSNVVINYINNTLHYLASNIKGNIKLRFQERQNQGTGIINKKDFTFFVHLHKYIQLPYKQNY